MSKSLSSQLVLMPIRFITKIMTTIFAAIIISILIEWLGMTFIWRDNPHHAKDMLNYEYELVSNSFESQIFGVYPHELIASSLQKTVQTIHKTGLINYVKSTSYQDNIFQTILYKFYDYIVAAGYIFLVVIMRAIVFLLSLPWYFICGIVALIDGVVERNIRKFEGGIEHGMIYHIAKSNLTFSIVIAFILYLGMPVSIHPSFILVPSGFLFGLIIYITAWSFKKYI